MYTSINDFKGELEQINWFENVGKGHSYPHRLNHWDDWNGPESLEAGCLGEWYGELEHSFHENGQLKPEFKPIWDDVHASVLKKCENAIEPPTNYDSWDPSSATKWQAAFVAVICHLFVATQRPWPKDLKTIWFWYKDGPWPCEHMLDTPDLRRRHDTLFGAPPATIKLIDVFEAYPNRFRIY